MANRLGNFLVSKGIQKEERVALYAHRSSALVVGIMGILKSGATFTVIDPAYPIERQVRAAPYTPGTRGTRADRVATLTLCFLALLL